MYFHKQRWQCQKISVRALAGDIGINVGIAAPMAFFPFSGWKTSFFVIYMGRVAMLLNSLRRKK
jgi:acyl-CoA reductase-like NAD-dependent aldehyde dehydrogenase